MVRTDFTIEDIQTALGRAPDGADVDNYGMGIARKLYDEGDAGAAVRVLARTLEIHPDRQQPSIRNRIQSKIDFLQGNCRVAARPLELIVSVTGKCNLNCLMCEARTGDELPEHTVQELIGLFPYLQSVQWLGGEVFLAKCFKELFFRASEYGHLHQGINTNGLLLQEEWLERFSAGRGSLDLVFSVDAVTKDTYEHIRRGARYETLLEKLSMAGSYGRRLPRARFKTALNFIVMKSNYRELEHLVDFAERHGIAEIQLNELISFKPEEVFRSEDLSGDAEARRFIREILPLVAKKAENSGIKLDNWLSGLKGHCENSTAASVCSLAPGDGKRPRCRAPWDRLSINFLGDVCPHRFCTVPVGNVIRTPIEEIWNGPELQSYRRRIAEGDQAGFCNPLCLAEGPVDNYFMGL